MGLLNKKYYELEPTHEYLTDKVVLAQAWKKAHQYIRSTNWYADTFELDKSAIDLDAKLGQWTNELISNNFSLNPLRLIPAPKSEQWEFKRIKNGLFGFTDVNDNEFLEEHLTNLNHCWTPKISEPSKSLRPLAHVTIRDQCFFTALMMCLANKVESLQKNTSIEFKELHVNGMVNYGNRLFCHFNDDEAHFSWGNSTTYSKYFSDYQRFLSRPIHFGLEAIQQKIKDEQVYEVHLDIEKFYDRIDRSLLIQKITDLIDEKEDPIVNQLLDSFNNWTWDKDSPPIYKEVCSEDESDIPSGIPQGLVAGGFLANIYLLDFDKWLNDQIGTMIIDGVYLIDYCRYVDDMRLIVVVKKSLSDTLKEKLPALIIDELGSLGLKLNQDKTSIELFSAKAGGISTKLKDIQSKVSGPLSINEVDEQLGHLEGLIGLADSLRNDGVDKENNNPLAMIESPGHDVREDTLLRFSANKIHTLLKQKRSLVAQEVDGGGKLIPGSWDYLQERMARKFIACWSKDPSLVLLLKKGLELFPDKKILNPILQQLDIVINRKNPRQVKIAEYCLCEIFRHTATNVYMKDRLCFPAHANVDGFFHKLQNLSVKFIENEKHENESVLEQARFFCLVLNDSPLDKDSKHASFNIITKMMKGYRSIKSDMSASDFVASTLLASQLAKDKSSVIRAVSCLLEKAVKNIPSTKNNNLNMLDANVFCRKIAAESLSFFSELVLYSKNNDLVWHKQYKVLIEKTGIDHLPITGDLNRFKTPVSLLGIIKRSDNPFAHENASLALLEAILNHEESIDLDKMLDMANCKISCEDWSNIQSLEVKLTFIPEYADDPLFPIPIWITDQHRPLYQLGAFLRSCLLGGIDWSSSNLMLSSQPNYTGLKTSFMKRQLGMMHSPEAINGERAPMSDWMSCLLFNLLQWPGTSLHDGGYHWPSDWNEKTLNKLIINRIAFQKLLYCKMSNIPGYVERVNLDWSKEKSDLKVMMVQSLLPTKSDFSKYGLKLNASKYRARHRRHIAAVAELLLHKLYSHNSIDDEKYKTANIDLIIWPELAVNNKDIDILERLADKTGAMILAGLTFLNIPGVDGPNNVAKWIIPKKDSSGRQFVVRLQGKQNMTEGEKGKVKSWRPYQLFIELMHPAFPEENGFRLTGSICYDATDIKISADLKDKSNAYLIPSLNRDVSTFDSMVDALFYHMFQHVVLVNTGEFGGSVAKAPYKEGYDKLITHVHGINQVSISSFQMNMFDFRNIGKSLRSGKEIKTKPAG
jgi:hypothetical protein